MEVSLLANQCVRRSLVRASSGVCNPATIRPFGDTLQVQLGRDQTSTRTFTTSTRRSRDTSSDSTSNTGSKDAPGQRIEQSAARSSHTPNSTGRPSNRPRRSYSNPPPGDSDRIDLSSIPGVGSQLGYAPPKRNPSEESARAKLSAMFKAAATQNQSSSGAANSEGVSSTNTRSSGFDSLAPSSSNSSSNTGLGSLDAYSRSYAKPIDMHKLVDNLSLNDPFSGGSANNTTPKIPLRLRPALGRTVAVSPSFDLPRAFRTLEAKCNANGVKRDERNQKFHVRAGKAKKIRRGQLWRVQFLSGYLHACERVRRMKAQGW